MGLPWLGASLRRTFRGMTVAYTLPGKYRLTSSATCMARLVRLSNMVISTPSSSSFRFRERREYRLKDALEEVKGRYDYIFIDCPPSLELLTLNALCAADTLLVPVQGEYYALEGLSDLMNTVRRVKRSLNPRLELEGVLMTMFDSRTNLAIQVAEEVKRYFPGKVYTTVVPRNVRLSEAPSHGKPINAYDRTSRGAEAYGLLAEEFLRKNR